MPACTLQHVPVPVEFPGFPIISLCWLCRCYASRWTCCRPRLRSCRCSGRRLRGPRPRASEACRMSPQPLPSHPLLQQHLHKPFLVSKPSAFCRSAMHHFRSNLLNRPCLQLLDAFWPLQPLPRHPLLWQHLHKPFLFNKPLPSANLQCITSIATFQTAHAFSCLMSFGPCSLFPGTLYSSSIFTSPSWSANCCLLSICNALLRQQPFKQPMLQLLDVIWHLQPPPRHHLL